jgi:hypothetical protein
MDDFVNEYFSVDRFKKSYASKFNPIASIYQCSHVDVGYKIKKPKLKRKLGRPTKSTIKPYAEVGTSQKVCYECSELGRIAKTCQGGPTTSQKRRQSTPQDGSRQGSTDPI